MKILVCEDDEIILKAIIFKLNHDGYEVTGAKDGKIASEIIKNQEFDLIITDQLMPYISGFELINIIRQDFKKTTPIIMLSRVGQEDSVVEALKAGADDYITKPFSSIELSIRIKKLIMRCPK